MSKNESRRKLLKSIAAGSGAVVAGKSIPESWTKPVIDSVMLPAHAQTTNENDSAGDQTPTTWTYFGTDLPMIKNQATVQTTIDKMGDILLSPAYADEPENNTLGGISVSITGGTATVRFLSRDRDNIHNATVMTDGTPSGTPVLEAGGCYDPSNGPASVQIMGYTDGDTSVMVRVNASNNPGWSVTVQQGAIGSLVYSGC